MVWSPGKQLQRGKYTIKRELGRGRIAITYLATDREGNPLALKTLNDELRYSSDYDRLEQAFVKEAFKLIRCSHPHIVKVNEPFQVDGVWCIPMEYIAGTNLVTRTQPILPEETALEYIQQIGSALSEVHSHGIVHRDVRPENIMVRSGEQQAVLIDFGLALDSDSELTQTRTEEIAEGFAPLELYSRGEPKGAYTDIYALGATLYLLLIGETPPNAKDRLLNHVPLRLPQEINPHISDRVNKAIIRAMALKPENRPQSIKEWFELMKLPVTTEETSKTKKASRSSISVIDQMIVLASGGAFVGGLIAQFYGAVIGAVFGAIFAVFYKKNRSHN